MNLIVISVLLLTIIGILDLIACWFVKFPEGDRWYFFIPYIGGFIMLIKYGRTN